MTKKIQASTEELCANYKKFPISIKKKAAILCLEDPEHCLAEKCDDIPVSTSITL